MGKAAFLFGGAFQYSSGVKRSDACTCTFWARPSRPFVS